jgi:hypothetical protein
METIAIGTWNVSGLTAKENGVNTDKVEEMIEKIEKAQIDVAVITETCEDRKTG